MGFDRTHVNKAMDEIDGLLGLRNRVSKALADKYYKVSLMLEKQGEEPEYIQLGQYATKVIQQLQGNLQAEIESKVSQLPGCVDITKAAKR